MVNQLSKFSEHLADKTKSIRDLLQKENQWTWGAEQQKVFERIRADLIQVPVLALYDPNKETKVAADASCYDLGGVVLQLQSDNSWRPISFLSRSMTPTETRYAQIEKEALALIWACERSWEYIVGKSIFVETDHKPLVPLNRTGYRSLCERPSTYRKSCESGVNTSVVRGRNTHQHTKEKPCSPGIKAGLAAATLTDTCSE